VRRSLDALTDTIRCPWHNRSWLLVAAAGVVGALGVLVAAAVGDLVLGRSDALFMGAGALLAVSAVATVLTAVLAEDRATGIGVHEPTAARLVASWRSARDAARRLRVIGRRIPAGPLGEAVVQEADAMARHLDVVRPALVTWWSNARRVDRWERQVRRGGAVDVQPVIDARRDGLRRAASAAADHLDALAASAERLASETDRRAGLDRLMTGIELTGPQPVLPERSDGLDTLAAALSELAALDHQLVDALVADARSH
jgi:hypothetical protein